MIYFHNHRIITIINTFYKHLGSNLNLFKWLLIKLKITHAGLNALIAISEHINLFDELTLQGFKKTNYFLVTRFQVLKDHCYHLLLLDDASA